MNQSWKINPSTGDYVIEDGNPVIDYTLETPALIRLKAAFGQWLYAPSGNWGSEFWSLREKRSSMGVERARRIAQRALQPFIDQGRAIDVEVEGFGEDRHAVVLDINITEIDGRQTQFKFLPITF